MWFQCYHQYENLGEYFVQMIGYCKTEYDQISIYEYMPGGTLQQHLHGEFLLPIVESKSK
jgi:hypothetical protein